MSKFFSSPSHKANIGYNGFDMSHVLKFSSTTGELLPVYRDFLQPGDKVTLNTELRTRTMPLDTAAMASITEYLEWFFVPITQIYQFFPDFFYGIQDYKTSLVSSQITLSDKFPYIPYSTLNEYVSSLNTVSYDHYFSNLTDLNGNARLSGMNLRLMECLGIPTSDIYQGLNTGISNYWQFDMALNPMYAAAYQKIYFDYYRLSDREPNDPNFYNLDVFQSSGQVGLDTVVNLFTMRYRPLMKDYFTYVQVSPLFGSSSLGNSGIDLTKSFSQWLTPVDLRTSDASGNQNTSNPTSLRPAVIPGTTGTTISSADTVLRNHLSPDAIRSSFALEKLLEVTRRAGKHYDKQTLAHFGIDVPNGINGEVFYLGSTCKSDIQIGDVISTSTVPDGSSLGQVGGKGYGYGHGNDIHFTAPCHGILMCIYSCSPVCDYPQLGVDKLLTMVDNSSFPRPEFDNLGMQPIFNYEAEHLNDDASGNAQVFGWQYRWSELKTKYNKVIGGLMAGRSLSSWSIQRSYFGTSNVNAFLTSPFELNSIMLVPFRSDITSSATVNTPYSSDPLIHQLYFDVKKASKMSEYGLPSL